MASDASGRSSRHDLPFLGSLKDIQVEHDGYVGARLGRAVGLVHFGVNHETIFPGGQSSRPHAHSKDNNTDGPIKLLIVGEHWPDDQVVYPVNPEIRHPRPWQDAPKRPLGPHDGRPAPSRSD